MFELGLILTEMRMMLQCIIFHGIHTLCLGCLKLTKSWLNTNYFVLFFTCIWWRQTQKCTLHKASSVV